MRVITSIIIAFIAFSHAFGQGKSLPLETSFENLKVSGNIHLVLVSSDTPKLIFVSEGNADALDIETSDALLSLKTKTELSQSAAVEVKLHYINLSALEITKGGRVQSADTLQSSILQLDVLTGGKAELRIRADSLSVRVNQGADIILYGRTRSQFVNAYTWGNYDATDLEAKDSYVKAATGAQVKVNTSGLLDANVTSKAYVAYLGKPEQLKVKTSVGGEITPLTE